MPGADILGVLLALVAAVAFGLGIVLQAADARSVPSSVGGVGLIARLIRRPRWLVGTVLGTMGFGVQAVALIFAPLTVVQPTLALSLVVILVYGSRISHEPITRVQVAGIGAIAVGVAGLALYSPGDVELGRDPSVLVIVMVLFAVATTLPWILRKSRLSAGWMVVLGAGVAYAWDGVALKLLADDISPEVVVIGLVVWLAIAAIAGLLALVLEMMAYQDQPPGKVAPVLFVSQMAIPAVLEPVFGVSWSHPWLIIIFLVLVAWGAVTLARSDAVGRVVSTPAASTS